MIYNNIIIIIRIIIITIITIIIMIGLGLRVVGVRLWRVRIVRSKLGFGVLGVRLYVGFRLFAHGYTKSLLAQVHALRVLSLRPMLRAGVKSFPVILPC